MAAQREGGRGAQYLTDTAKGAKAGKHVGRSCILLELSGAGTKAAGVLQCRTVLAVRGSLHYLDGVLEWRGTEEPECYSTAEWIRALKAPPCPCLLSLRQIADGVVQKLLSAACVCGSVSGAL